MSISVKILVKNYAIADFALSYYANADFANAKNSKIILHKHEKQRENTRTRKRAENGRKSAKKRQKNGKNATTASGANDEQIRINGINTRRKLLLYIDLVQLYYLQLQKMQMQILHSFALSYYANADFATRLHYVYEFVFVYVFDYVFEYVYVFVFEYDYSSTI